MIETVERTIYFFECKLCKVKRRQTLKHDRAINQICRSCRKPKATAEGQTSLFDGVIGT